MLTYGSSISSGGISSLCKSTMKHFDGTPVCSAGRKVKAYPLVQMGGATPDGAAKSGIVEAKGRAGVELGKRRAAMGVGWANWPKRECDKVAQVQPVVPSGAYPRARQQGWSLCKVVCQGLPEAWSLP